LKKKILGAILCFITSFLVMLFWWIEDTFGKITIEQIIFHITVPMKGSENSLFISFILVVLGIPFLVSIAYLIYHYLKNRCNFSTFIPYLQKYNIIFFVLLFCSVVSIPFFVPTISPTKFYQTNKNNPIENNTILYITHDLLKEKQMTLQELLDRNVHYIQLDLFTLPSQEIVILPTQEQLKLIQEKEDCCIADLGDIISLKELCPYFEKKKDLILFTKMTPYFTDCLLLWNQFPFASQCIIETFNIYSYQFMTKSNFKYFVVPFNTLAYKKDVRRLFRQHVQIISCPESMLNDTYYRPILQELHHRGMTIFVYPEPNTKESHHSKDYGFIFDGIFSSTMQKNS